MKVYNITHSKKHIFEVVVYFAKYGLTLVDSFLHFKCAGVGSMFHMQENLKCRMKCARIFLKRYKFFLHVIITQLFLHV